MPAPLVQVLDAAGKTSAFPIQQDTLPDTLDGRDVLGRGKTGSGKTLAFSIPLAARLAASGAGPAAPRRPRGLVLAPTRELATQIAEALAPLAEAYGMRTTTIYGGVNQKRQTDALARGVDVVVACPGRLEDLLGQGELSLGDVEVTVLDEADHMADLGFLPGVTRILAQTPDTGQRLFFSATLDKEVDKLVRRFLHDEVLHSVDDPTSHVSAMTHHVFEVSADDKKPLVQALASGRGKRLLFTRTKHQAKRLAKQLTTQGIPAVDLHGNLSQNQRDRSLAAFGQGDVQVLVATDVAARGVHVDAIELVVHVDPPAEHKAYLHRSGRTARAGSAGDVVTVMLPEQRRDTEQLLRKAAIDAKPVSVTPDSTAVAELVGEQAAHVEPAPRGASGGAPKGGQNGGQKGSRNGSGGSRGGSRGSSGKGRGRGSERGSGQSSGQGQGSGQSRGARSSGQNSGTPAGQGAGRGSSRGRRGGRGQGDQGGRRASAPAGSPARG
ncbi:DEAD/DEAH box helicase [Nesterenkonia sp. F]|uniref:DEAD/DEAH box helicase n=1 Tax=Nesterenkonia sp. F TaxID=795955 RepID=UPI001ED943BB|nr:DEAD/DEAH box helicase [Nesterenkonia sp. F]